MRDDERLDLARRAVTDGACDALEAVVLDRRVALTRFTKNAIHQNLDEAEAVVQFRAVVDGRAGWASTNARSEDALRITRDRAIAQARFAPKPAVPVTLPPSASYAPPNGAFDAATASASPAVRAAAAAKIFDVASRESAWAAGYVSSLESGIAVANSVGVRANFAATDAEINVKCVAPNASGYAEALSRNIGKLDATSVAERAAGKARDAGMLQAPDVGDWTVILEPAALGELLVYVLSHFSAQRVHEGASFLSDGLDRMYAGPAITLVDDYAHPLHAACPFDGEGTPTQRVTLLEAGMGKDFVTDTEWAQRLNRRNTGHYSLESAEGPQVRAPVLLPGSRSIEELIASTRRGILITRFWYIRVVDTRKTIVTGMTRDGTFAIENGKIGGGLRNLRFNVNILELLRACELSNSLSRTGGYYYSIVVPAAKLEKFHVSSVTSY